MDTTFDSDGIVTTDFGASDDFGYAIAVQSDGKILVAGDSNIGGSDDFALTRYNSDGSLDITFGGGDGILTTDFSGNNDTARSIVVQSDGKILLGGQSDNGSNEDFAAARYNSDGTLDTTFGGGDGLVTTDFGGGYDYGKGIAVQSDGKILLGGQSNGSNSDFALVRYNSDGSLDTSFDGDGIVTTDFGGSGDYGRSVAVQSDGKILMGGESDINGNDDFAVVRYNSDGSLDTSFDGDGIVTTNISGNADISRNIAVQSNGKILLAGESSNGTDYDLGLIR